jgi:hypothetical protein
LSAEPSPTRRWQDGRHLPAHRELTARGVRQPKYDAGLDRAIEKGWLVLHESGTYVKFTQAGAELFA